MNDSPGPSGPLTIAAWGSFAAGGTQISAPGAFDPRNQMDPSGQTLRGDHARVAPTDIQGRDNWRVRLAMARLFVETINRHGGDAELVSLPDIGIRSNTHFTFSDLNNVQVADQMSAFLAKKDMD